MLYIHKKIQETQLTPGAFYFTWTSLQITLNEEKRQLNRNGIPYQLCNELSKRMAEKGVTLMENKLLAAAIFVEPQFRGVLDDGQLRYAKTSFVEIAVHIKKQKLLSQAVVNETEDLNLSGTPSQSNISSELQVQNIQHPNAGTLDDTHLDLDEYSAHWIDSSPSTGELNGDRVLMEISRQRHQQRRSVVTCSMTQELARYRVLINECLDQMDKFGPEHNLIDSLWKYPTEARHVALTLCALPTSQVSVERLFSSLKRLYRPLNTNTGDDLVDAEMFLRWNGCE